MAKAQEPEGTGFVARLKQIVLVFKLTAKRDKIFIPLVAGAVAIALVVTVVLFLWMGWPSIFAGVMLVLLAVLIVLNLRANKVFMAEAENTPGAAASIVENLRGDWRVTPAFASTTSMDFVHLVISQRGVILLGEGEPGRVKAMISQEKRRLAKVIGSAELTDFMIGNGEGQLPVRKLRTTLTRLPKTLNPKDVSALDKRLKALSARPQMPKGAIPKSMRPPKGAFRASRGR